MEPESKNVETEEKLPVTDTKVIDDKKGQGKEHEPAVDSPRWKELYWKNEENKRKIQQIEKGRDEDKGVMKEMASFNKTMRDSMTRIEDNQYDSIKEPDLTDDPEGYKQFHFNKGKHEAEKDSRTKEPKAPDKVEPKKTPWDNAQQVTRWMFPDYDKLVTSELNAEIESNPVLADRIMNSKEFPGNPPRAAYEYAKEKIRKNKETNDQNLDASYTEGSTTQSSNNKKKRVLDDRQKRAAKNFGMTEAEYSEQLTLCEKDYEEELNDTDRG